MAVECASIPSGSVNVLWDGGSTVSLITFSKAKELGLKGKQVHLSIVKVGGNKEEISSYLYDLPLKNRDGEVVILQVYGIDKVSTHLKPIDLSDVIKLFKNVSELELQRPEGEVDVLVGFEYAGYHPVREQSVNNLLVLRNQFGVCMGGSHKLLQEKTRKVVQTVIIHHLRQVTVEDFFETESLGVSCTPKCGGCRCGNCHLGSKDYSLKEERELNLIEAGLEHCGDHWVAKYPWIRDPYDLPDNKVAALKMLESTERRLLKTEDHAKIYLDQIVDMIERGVARRLSETEATEYKGPVFYVSHHEVLKPSSASTPCRIVFNSSARFHGHAINEYWAKGPDLMNNMLGVLLRFRENAVAVTGDIKKMYHSVKISDIDQHTHRFLWRDFDVSRDPDVYVMTSVSFGDRPAGNIATLALRKTAEMGMQKFPKAAETILNNTYVDDILDSMSSTEEAVKLTKDVNQLIEPGGFVIKEWCISDSEAHTDPDESIDDESIEKRQFIGQDHKVLGVEWRPETDSFQLQTNLNFSPRYRKQRTTPSLKLSDLPDALPSVLTKRIILSQVNGIYDPLGLATPFTIQAKILLRRLHIEANKKLQWDDPIAEEDRDDWLSFFQDMFQMTTATFQRCVRPYDAVGDPVLVMFSDGSNEAYGACSYARWETHSGEYLSRLIASKSRVAPSRKISIVRLELCGALLSARLAAFIKKEMRLKFTKEYYIVDSEIIRSMIQKESYGFNTFAGLRVGEIQELSDAGRWYWVDGKFNIADWTTRPKRPSEITKNSIWQQGPDFLRAPEDEWPIRQDKITKVLPELVKKVIVLAVGEEQIPEHVIIIQKFSKFTILIRVTARVLAVFQRKPAASLLSMLTPPDRPSQEFAIVFWVRVVQKAMIADFNANKYERLCARMDERGLIVVGGRAERWLQMSFQHQPLLLLSYGHEFSRLYVRFIHEIAHLGVASTVSKVRLRFWIVRLSKLVKSVQNKCIKCKAMRKIKNEQIMGELPVDRLKPAPPFFNTSLDFFGPFLVRGETNKRSRGKAYGIIYNCLLSRAVHIELSTDYSTNGFLIALRRFMSIRGQPAKIRSDSGSQLVAANRELKEIIQGLEKKQLLEFGSEKGIDWEFSSPDAPWQNGCAESLIKSVKKAITGAIGSQVLMFSELLTVCYEAANLVNERPIGTNPKDPNDGTYLCPNDLLLGRASSRILAGPFSDDPNPRKRFFFLQMLVNAFWRKWTRDYFPSLIIRQKWHTERRNVQIDDVVLIQDANAVRGNWKLGKVSKVFPGVDGKVRNVEVQYKILDSNEKPTHYKGRKYMTVTRPVQRLVVLLANDENANG